MTFPVSDKRTALLAAARDRILVLDGAMGTMIQGLEYDEAAFCAFCGRMPSRWLMAKTRSARFMV